MIKTILFDLDGTLLDTLPDIHKSLNETLAAFSFPPVTKEQTRAYIGNGAELLVKRAIPAGADLDACFAKFTEIFSANKGEETKPFPGVCEGLARFKAQGYQLGVISNKPQYATSFLTEKFFSGQLDFVAGDGGIFPRKPDPTLARYCALALRSAPAECAFVGDGETDVKTALNAKMCGVAVLWGYRSKAQLEEAGAVRFVKSFEELENLVKIL